MKIIALCFSNTNKAIQPTNQKSKSNKHRTNKQQSNKQLNRQNFDTGTLLFG